MMGLFLTAFNYDYVLDSHYAITSFVQNFPFISLILALVMGVSCAALSPRKARNVLITTLSVITIGNILNLIYCVNVGDYYVYMMGHFPAPWGNEIRIGVLEATFALMVSVVMLLSHLGGLKHIYEDVPIEKQNYYYLMTTLLYTSLLAIIYTNDLFTAYVFIEINTLTSCAIVMLKRGKETLIATTRYLIMSLLGSGLILIGISILYDITGHLLMSDIKVAVGELVSTGKYTLPLEMIICLFAIGLGVKSALYPFHSWLPDAHGSSTSASSAILSGLVLKGYIILLIKICYRVIGMDVIAKSHVLDLLFVFGILAMTIGSIKAIREKDLKRMIAYSSIAQIGYIYLGIGIGTDVGMAAACFQIFAHAVTKPMLFNTAGAFMEECGGSKKFKDLEGAARKNLFAGLAFAIGALSMIGIPLFAGFNVKYFLAMAAIESGRNVILTCAALIVSAVLNAVYYIPAMMVLFKKTDETKQIKMWGTKLDYAYIGSTIVFVALNVFLGIGGSSLLMNLINQGLKMLA